MAVPNHSPLQWPAALTTPMGPAPGTVAQSLAASVHGPIGGGSSTADYNAEGIIQKGYVINSYAGKYQNTKINEGHLVFIHRGDPTPQAPGAKGSADATAHTVVSLAMMNMILNDGYEESLVNLRTYSDKQRGLVGAGLLKFLELPEVCWGELYANNGKTIRADKTFKNYYWLSQQGVLERWNFLGISILSSAPDTQTHGEMAYLPLNVAMKGVRKYVANVWGESAGQLSNLFLVLKRRVNPMTREWGAFGFHPYATNEKQVPLAFRQYQGLSGATEYGTVFPVGIVRDPRQMTLPPEKLSYVQGLHPESSPSKEVELAKQCPVLDVAIHQLLCKVVVAC